MENLRIIHKADEKKNENFINRSLKVVRKAQNKLYVNGINIQGRYLEKFGFNYGDELEVKIRHGLIVIINKEV